MLFELFGYLSSSEFMQLRQVCKKFKQLMDSIEFKELHFSIDQQFERTTRNSFFSKRPSLTVLKKCIDFGLKGPLSVRDPASTFYPTHTLQRSSSGSGSW